MGAAAEQAIIDFLRRRYARAVASGDDQTAARLRAELDRLMNGAAPEPDPARARSRAAAGSLSAGGAGRRRPSGGQVADGLPAVRERRGPPARRPSPALRTARPTRPAARPAALAVAARCAPGSLSEGLGPGG